MSNNLGKMLRKRTNSRDVPPHMTYMIAEKFVTDLDVTRLRDYGIGERNPDTLPGKALNSETDNANRNHSRDWRTLRKRTASIEFIGHKY